MFSALAALCTVDCAIEIVIITLHYYTLDDKFLLQPGSGDIIMSNHSLSFTAAGDDGGGVGDESNRETAVDHVHL